MRNEENLSIGYMADAAVPKSKARTTALTGTATAEACLCWGSCGHRRDYRARARHRAAVSASTGT